MSESLQLPKNQVTKMVGLILFLLEIGRLAGEFRIILIRLKLFVIYGLILLIFKEPILHEADALMKNVYNSAKVFDVSLLSLILFHEMALNLRYLQLKLIMLVMVPSLS